MMLAYKNQELKIKYESYNFDHMLNNIDIIGTQYTIDAKLRSNNKKATYIITNKDFTQKYILKLKLKDYIHSNEINNYKILKQNLYPTINKIIQIYETSKLYLIISEYFEGITLNLCSQFFNFTYGSLENIFIQAINGLIFLHGLSIVHGDISPYNILVKQDIFQYQLVIIDFDLTKNINDNICGKNYGTDGFIAPECANGIHTYKSDIWALGQTFNICFSSLINDNKHKKKSLYKIINRMTSIDEDTRPELGEILDWFN